MQPGTDQTDKRSCEQQSRALARCTRVGPHSRFITQNLDPVHRWTGQVSQQFSWIRCSPLRNWTGLYRSWTQFYERETENYMAWETFTRAQHVEHTFVEATLNACTNVNPLSKKSSSYSRNTLKEQFVHWRFDRERRKIYLGNIISPEQWKKADQDQCSVGSLVSLIKPTENGGIRVTENATEDRSASNNRQRSFNLSRDDSRITAPTNSRFNDSLDQFRFTPEKARGKKVSAREFVASGYQLRVSLINAGKARLVLAAGTIIQIARCD